MLEQYLCELEPILDPRCLDVPERRTEQQSGHRKHTDDFISRGPRSHSRLQRVCDSSLAVTAVSGLPYIRAGADLVDLIVTALERQGLVLAAQDVVVVTSKIVARAEGRTVRLDTVSPSTRAMELAASTGGDPRIIELVLAESSAISRVGPGLLIVRHRLGFVCANAGIDRSNIDDGCVLLLPLDPDASAERLRAGLAARFGNVPIGLVLSDSHGRAFRLGTVGVAVGVAGLPALCDHRGDPDLNGRVLQYTITAFADQIAALGDLVAGQADEGRAVVHVRGLRLQAGRGCASDLVRPFAQDVYA